LYTKPRINFIRQWPGKYHPDFWLNPQFVTLPIEGWSFTDMQLVEADKVYKFKVTGNDPVLRSPTLKIAADDYYNVIVNMTAPPPIECSMLVLYFTRPEAPIEAEERAIRYNFKPSDTSQAIALNVRNYPEWGGYHRTYPG
jgi:hypothetical protein